MRRVFICIALLAAACAGSTSGTDDGGGSCVPGTNCQVLQCTSSGAVCAKTGKGPACLTNCGPGGGSCGPTQQCTQISGCCFGTACSAILVHACCEPGQC
jgi:hypothetical protein